MLIVKSFKKLRRRHETIVLLFQFVNPSTFQRVNPPRSQQLAAATRHPGGTLQQLTAAASRLAGGSSQQQLTTAVISRKEYEIL